MRNYFLVALTILLVTACNPKSSDTTEIPYNYSEHFNHNWAMDKLWEDGLAEVAHYDAEMVIYNKVRKFDNVYVTVKEEFNEAFNVKTDDYSRPDLFSVMKVNKFLRLETENYPYHFLSSLFFKRDKPAQLYKMTHTGQEWCGNTFKQFEVTPTGYDYDYNSYFDGYGDGFRTIENNEALWEDQLSYALRSLNFEDGLKFTYKVYEGQINTKTRLPKLYEAEFNVTDLDSLWKVSVILEEGKENEYQFNKAYPNLMISQKTWHGYNLKLNNVSRYQYWR